MEFKWQQIDKFSLHLIDYDDAVIATLYWKPHIERWCLTSSWFDYYEEYPEDFELKDIEDIKVKTIETLKKSCKEQIEWYQEQIKELENI